MLKITVNKLREVILNFDSCKYSSKSDLEASFCVVEELDALCAIPDYEKIDISFYLTQEWY